MPRPRLKQRRAVPSPAQRGGREAGSGGRSRCAGAETPARVGSARRPRRGGACGALTPRRFRRRPAWKPDGAARAAPRQLRAAGAAERGGAPLPAGPAVSAPGTGPRPAAAPAAGTPLPPSLPSALLPRRELPDGGARPSVAQFKQLVVSALRELHGEVGRHRAPSRRVAAAAGVPPARPPRGAQGTGRRPSRGEGGRAAGGLGVQAAVLGLRRRDGCLRLASPLTSSLRSSPRGNLLPVKLALSVCLSVRSNVWLLEFGILLLSLGRGYKRRTMGTAPWMGKSTALSVLCLEHCRGLEASHITAASLLLQW